ncbi:MAG: hypothetical protein AB2693_33310 [Candidatus Thiodiazotropha sp.]
MMYQGLSASRILLEAEIGIRQLKADIMVSNHYTSQNEGESNILNGSNAVGEWVLWDITDPLMGKKNAYSKCSCKNERFFCEKREELWSSGLSMVLKVPHRISQCQKIVNPVLNWSFIGKGPKDVDIYRLCVKIRWVYSRQVEKYTFYLRLVLVSVQVFKG